MKLNSKMTILLMSLMAIFIAEQSYGFDIRKSLTLTGDHHFQSDVARGRLEGPLEFHSAIFANTVRQYWIFVPAQYSKDKPASLLVFQDGQRAVNPKGSLRVPLVMENLIAQGDMPVTIGVFVTPGHAAKRYPDNLGFGNPDQRAQEYDVLDDKYVRMLTEELLPQIEKRYRLTQDPEQRLIGGTSSGAIAAFTAAWHRPDYFRKVFSGIGSYVSIGFKPNTDPVALGGQDYPDLIRREAIRPLKLFLQDGVNDLDNEWGNWFLANQQMVKAFAYANRIADQNQSKGPRYVINTVWTDGEHNDNDPGALLPEALRWLWQSP